MISNCGHDERGKYSGGKAGDQTGTEWQVINWYNRPWKCVLRHPDAATRKLIAQMAKAAADTAAQVRTLQRQGVRVSAVFMGEDSSAGAATQIYGKNMARIRGMDQLARAAGRLIQNEIRELGD